MGTDFELDQENRSFMGVLPDIENGADNADELQFMGIPRLSAEVLFDSGNLSASAMFEARYTSDRQLLLNDE